MNMKQICCEFWGDFIFMNEYYHAYYKHLIRLHKGYFDNHIEFVDYLSTSNCHDIVF